ncbi:MAG: DUF1062 domain-containing protein [Mesorhizobium sp.]|uniref:DUF1062 domain-containing protein n=1 Tax=unclassified Mesorhizobium TaxID=325217 RepID=UPI000F75F55E|nr:MULTISPECIES: DUF1062 domain-containing protein [unclassified Mesorhizobium]RUX99235.1 DUF1062 domain-containing protein [Mesorhizobium sp. M2A.F.Ca.ET.040.01.1.1]RVC58129.1 DUF1062 domain-containing protein [Mesorhizobium sp. M00.F.Ca.ET.038.03.1.1]AZO35829.1 DUF1062 domain-containing protein [Mesorhizobium sp. M2A.F.Ca.ET.046.03.2.1]RWA84761.1 MAG: DUF1062 domain-containing protein [Mesorhizobium sp.]RWB44037.1 MAG: DUF1062 domain-containing protein [Mesorhizobium sp.]
MSSTLRVLWTIAPAIAPRPFINCNRCGGFRPYKCSEKFRVNANGKRIDVWLIYRCSGCENSWNFTILERQNRHDIEPALLAALESNDPALARRHAFDAAPLRNRAGRVEESPDVTVRKEPLDGEPGHANALALELRLEGTTPLRLDRLLAGELGLSRSRLQALDDRRRLTMEPDGAKALRKPVRDGLAVRIGLADEADCRAILSAACR